MNTIAVWSHLWKSKGPPEKPQRAKKTEHRDRKKTSCDEEEIDCNLDNLETGRQEVFR